MSFSMKIWQVAEDGDPWLQLDFVVRQINALTKRQGWMPV